MCPILLPKCFNSIPTVDVGQQLKSLVDDDELTLDLPLHFVDQAPAKFSGPGLTPEDMYACSFNGWVYSTLTSKKLCLPSFENIFAEEIGQLKRPEVGHCVWFMTFSCFIKFLKKSAFLRVRACKLHLIKKNLHFIDTRT